MGLFRDLGRRAERFKQSVEAAADANHECDDCGALFEGTRDRCPECDGEVVAIDRG